MGFGEMIMMWNDRVASTWEEKKFRAHDHKINWNSLKQQVEWMLYSLLIIIIRLYQSIYNSDVSIYWLAPNSKQKSLIC